jgi:hypothetical protein
MEVHYSLIICKTGDTLSKLFAVYQFLPSLAVRAFLTRRQVGTAPLLVRDIGSQEVYALDFEAP